jgi:hypothetical protein
MANSFPHSTTLSTIATHTHVAPSTTADPTILYLPDRGRPEELRAILRKQRRDDVSTRIGPLTTLFVPPSFCTQLFAENIDNPPGYFYGYDVYAPFQYHQNDCWPSNYYAASEINDVYQNYYSPGACPSGWTLATYSTKDGAETTGACCPPNFTLTDISECEYTTTTIDTPGSYYKISTTGHTTITTVYPTQIDIEDFTYVADPLYIRWQSTDLSVLTPLGLLRSATTASTSSQTGSSQSSSSSDTDTGASSSQNDSSTETSDSTSTSSVSTGDGSHETSLLTIISIGTSSNGVVYTATDTIGSEVGQSSISSPIPSSTGGGLSTGAKIGLGVGIPLAVLALLGLLACLFLRRRGKVHELSAHRSQPPGEISAYQESAEKNNRGVLAFGELPGRTPQLDGNSRSEMEGLSMNRVELEGHGVFVPIDTKEIPHVYAMAEKANGPGLYPTPHPTANTGEYDTFGTGTMGSGTMDSGTVGSGTIGSGTIGSGTIGSGTIGSDSLGGGTLRTVTPRNETMGI